MTSERSVGMGTGAGVTVGRRTGADEGDATTLVSDVGDIPSIRTMGVLAFTAKSAVGNNVACPRSISLFELLGERFEMSVKNAATKPTPTIATRVNMAIKRMALRQSPPE
jgi:hypothetical protein